MAREIKKPVLRQLNVPDYEFTQIQRFSDQALKETNRYIDLQSTKFSVVRSRYQISFPINAGQRNAYLTMSEAIYDPFNAYNTQTGVFTAQENALHNVIVNILLSTSAGGDFGLFVQVNKSAITPQATQGTNFDSVLVYAPIAGTKFTLAGGKFLQLRKGDEVRIFLYSSVDNPSILPSDNDTAQVMFSW